MQKQEKKYRLTFGMVLAFHRDYLFVCSLLLCSELYRQGVRIGMVLKEWDGETLSFQEKKEANNWMLTILPKKINKDTPTKLSFACEAGSINNNDQVTVLTKPFLCEELSIPEYLGEGRYPLPLDVYTEKQGSQQCLLTGQFFAKGTIPRWF